MDGLTVDQVVEVPDALDRLTSQNINVIDCASDISDDEWKSNNKRGRLFIAPCSGPNRSELQGNIQKIALRTTPRSALCPKENAVDSTPDRLASHNVDVIDCASDLSNDGRRTNNKRKTRITPPSKSAFYSMGDAVDDTFNHGGNNNNPSKDIGKSRTTSSSQFQMPACQVHSNVVDLTTHDSHSNICQNYIAESSKGEQNSKEMVDKRLSPLLIADDTDIGEIYENPRTSHRTQEFDSPQDDSGSSRELRVKEKGSCRQKGKGILTEEDFDGKRKLLSGRTLASKLDGVGRANKEACVGSEDSSGWVSTRTRKLNPSSSDEEHLCDREDDPRNVTKRPRNVVVRRYNEDGSNARNHSSSSQNLSVPSKSLILSQEHRGCLLNKKPGSSHKTQNSDSHQDDSGTSWELMVKEKDSRRLKGKERLTEEEFDEKRKPLVGRTCAGKLDGVGPDNKEACVRSEDSPGWRSTRKRTRNLNPSLADEEHLCHKEVDPGNVTKRPRNVVVRRDNEDGNIARNHSVSSQNLSVAPISLTLSQQRRGCPLNDHHGSSNTAFKRRKKSSGTHHCGSSSSRIGNSKVDFGSSGEPSNVRSVRTQNRCTAGSFSRIVDIDDFSLDRSNGSHNRDCSRNSESEVRATQVEDDEILALELQEQLYNESNVAADREIDEQIVWELYQGSFQYTFPSGSHHESHPTSSFMSNLHRQYISESSQNSSTHRVTQDRVPTATRMPQTRRRIPAEPRTRSSRQRSPQYPPRMDVDMRMYVLEALESVNNIGVARGLLQRDFNENDYEMLLALDENNHQHCGASEARINGLPESMVQTDNLEACSVCLETPSIGDTMRHLPCLHRFHKDCIDEWLRRRSSCPICKSFI